ncbi:MAG: ABC transporter permease [Buchananella hordeovulneris]|nr:ABC transporter permease [Buchananella hordeovulneris]
MEERDYKTPGLSSGLLEVFKNPFLTSLIVHKELRARYRGSVLGMLWSYAKPVTQFMVFYFAIGVFMRMNRAIPDYVIYMFSGVILINYFSEVLGNATRSVVGNGALVKKIYLPRELFPVSALWVALAHFLPQVVVLVAGALFFGWAPSLLQLAAILVAFLIVSCFALGLGLFAGALNVFYRDAENFVDLALMLVTWISPVLYTWQMVYEVAASKGMWLWQLYQFNPLSVAVELFHYGFWQSERTVEVLPALPPNMMTHVWVAVAVALVSLVAGELYFRRADSRFAQEL